VGLDSLDRVSQQRSSSSPYGSTSGLEATGASSSEVLIEARGLRKTFGDFVAVDGIDVQVRRGEAFGFLGPNGAGKSSTMRMVGCISPPSGGVLRVLGRDPATDGAQIRARLGVVPQDDSLDGELTVLDNLVVYARYFGYSRADSYARARRLLGFASLEDRADSLVEPLSGGMKRRLTIARSLVNDPEILLLDEPTTGLDPQARHVLWDRLFRLKRQGVTLVLTTHYMDEAEQLCDRLVVMDHGRIVAEGSPRELIDTWSSREVLELRFSDDDLTPHAERLDGVVAQGVAARVEVLPDRLLVYADDGEAASSRIHDVGLRPMSSLVRRSSLEDVFLRLTGRTLVD
jgi:lipooligosaccharide transport system ATP-binding protein